jgi:hypothetical protein
MSRPERDVHQRRVDSARRDCDAPTACRLPKWLAPGGGGRSVEVFRLGRDADHSPAPSGAIAPLPNTSSMHNAYVTYTTILGSPLRTGTGLGWGLSQCDPVVCGIANILTSVGRAWRHGEGGAQFYDCVYVCD